MGNYCDVSTVIAISIFAGIILLFYLAWLCLYNDENNYEHAHNRHTRESEGGREESLKVDAKT